MLTSLFSKLDSFNPTRPYVWELKVTEDEFLSLEADLCSYTPDASKKDDALKMLVYVAEWYKRRYTNRAKKDYQKTFGGKKPDLKKVWETLDIDKRFVYEGANGQCLYLYSTFVLGGLAIKFEQQRNERPFLRSLCVILNGEEDSFDNLKDGGHAIAFSESVRQEHSMKYYLEAIVKHHDDPDYLPFAREDYDNADTQIKELIKLIKEINDAVQKSKFRLEWVFNAPYGDNMITRALHLWLNPYKGDGEKRHLYGYNDIHDKWGVYNPGEQHYIRIGVRFLLQKGKDEPILVQDANPNHPAISFRNTGNESVGFIASEQDYAVVNRVPVTEFNKVSIVCWDDEGNEYPIAAEDANFDAVQLYRMDKFEDYWTTRILPKRETVVIFNDQYAIAEESDDKGFEVKTLYGKRYGEGVKINWCPVRIAVVLKDKDGIQLEPFVNKQGVSKVLSHLYKETIQYSPDGTLNWRHRDADTEEETTNFVFLVTKKEDVLVYFKDDNEEGEEKAGEIIAADLVQFKASNGQYVDWEEEREPAYGINYIRVYSRHKLINKDERIAIFYLPGGMHRDCVENLITYVEGGKEVVVSDREAIELCKAKRQVLMPTRNVVIRYGDNDFVDVPIYRPVKLKEVCYDGKILMYDENGEVEIPYILKEYVDVNDYGKDGYHSYSCKDFKNVFVELNNSDYRMGGKYTSAIDGLTFSDERAPEGVTFFVRKTLSRNPRLRYCYWDCKKDSKPIPVRNLETFELPSGNVLFQDQRRVSHRLQCEYMEKEATGFAKIKKKGCSENDPVFEVYSVASEYNQYFFHFKALRTLANGILEGKRDFYEEIYNPLLEYHQHKFSMRDKKELLRFADEFCLDELKEQLITKFINIL